MKKHISIIVSWCLSSFLSLQWLPFASAQGTPTGRTEFAPAMPGTSSVLDQVRRRGVIRVAVVVASPWAMPNSKGELIGFEVDVARKLAADLGVQVEFVRSSWEGASEQVVHGHADIVAAGLWSNPRQALRVNFSNAYAKSQVAIFVPAGRSQNAIKLADFNRAEVVLAVREHSLALIEAKIRLSRATVKSYKTDGEAIDAALKGEVTALLADSPLADYLGASSAGKLVKALTHPVAERGESFAVPRGDADFVFYLNAWINYYKERGWLDERRAYWFSIQE